MSVPSHPITKLGNQDIVWGTAMLGTTYGQIENTDENLTANLEEIKDALGNNMTVLLVNERFELDLTAILDANASSPELGDDITFPSAGITGQITERGRTWTAGGVLKIKIKAFHWKSMGSSPAKGTVEMP